MKNFAILIALVTAAVAAGWYFTRESSTPGGAAGGPGGRGETPVVAVAPVRQETLVDTVEALGTATANESVTLTAKVTDTVRRVNFEDGDFVEAGAVLIELTNREEEALLAEARANLEDAQTQLRRLEEVSAAGLAPASDLDMARSRAAASSARLDTVVARLRDRLILAPFAGVLGFRQVSPGTLLTPNTPITTLDDISTIKLDFTVPEIYLGAIEPGATVLAQSAGFVEEMFEGTVRTVGSRVDPVTRAVTVRAHIANDGRELRPGMLLTVRVVMAERESLVVDEGAVFELSGQAYVYTVDTDLVAHQRPIEIGERRFGRVEVVDGLAEGEQVVTEGTIKLREGVRVRLAESDSEISNAVPSDFLQDPPAARI